MINPGDPWALLGREDEQRRLDRHVRDGQSVIVCGLAGIGKSALVEAVSRALPSEFQRYPIDCDRENTTIEWLSRWRMPWPSSTTVSILPIQSEFATPYWLA